MPPPIGFNKIANFHVTSFFHLGAALFMAAIVALVVGFVFFWQAETRYGRG